MTQRNGTAEVVAPTLQERMQAAVDRHNHLAQHIQGLQAQMEEAERQRQQAIGQMNMLQELLKAEAEA